MSSSILSVIITILLILNMYNFGVLSSGYIMFDNIDNKLYLYDDHHKYLNQNYDTLGHDKLINDNNDKLNIFPMIHDKMYYIQRNKIWSQNIHNLKTSEHIELSKISSSHSEESRLISIQHINDEYILCHGQNSKDDDKLYIISVNNQQLIITSSLSSNLNVPQSLKINLHYRHKKGTCIIRNNTLYIISKNRVKSGVNNIHKVQSEIFSHFPSSSLLVIEYIDTQNLISNVNPDNINNHENIKEINTCFHIFNVPNSYNNTNDKIHSINIEQDIIILDTEYLYKLDSNLTLCQYNLYELQRKRNEMISMNAS